MKSLLAALGLSLVLGLNAFAGDIAVVENGEKTDLLARPTETHMQQVLQLGEKTVVQDPQACFDEYHACSYNNDCCGSMNCVKYGTGLYCRY